MRFKVRFLSIFSIVSFSLFSQDYYKEIEQSLLKCGLNIYNKSTDLNNKNLIIETDSINSKNYSKIRIVRLNRLIKNSDYEKIDSIIKRRYIGKEIISKARTRENYGTLHIFVLNDKNRNLYYDKYVVKKYGNESILISYNSIMGNNRKNFENLECMIENLE